MTRARVSVRCLLSLSLILPSCFVCRSADAQPPDYRFVAQPTVAPYNELNGVGSFAQLLSIVEIPTGPTANDSTGFVMAFEYDGAAIQAIGVEPVGILALICGGGPEFFLVDLAPPNCNSAVTIAVVYGILCDVWIDHTVYQDLIQVQYDTVPAQLAGATTSTTVDVTFADSCGDPPLANQVIFGGQPFVPTLVSGTITLEPVTPTPYLAGDCNADGAVDIGDPIWSWSELFEGGPAAPCRQACEVNGDGDYDIGDSVYLLSYLFQAGPPPPVPYPDCAAGFPNPLGCDFYDACP